jgi:hypothetical protein
MNDEKEFKEVALQSFVDGDRVLTHELTKGQARAVRIAARHLADYLTGEYELDEVKNCPIDKHAPDCDCEGFGGSR